MVSVKKTDINNKITVKTNKETNVFSIKDNLSEYYAKLAERWANSPDMVNGIDYSSKYYAEQSKASAQIASDIKSETQALVDSFDNNVQIAKDDIEQNRINSINAIDNTYSVAVGDMQEKSDEVLTNIETSKVEAIERLKQSSTALTQSQISNCLLEVPQRIKYTFENGTFTLLKGSVMIFPHGTTDLSSSYPIGSDYYNSNFKVVDRQYANGLFFVWAEMQTDKTISQAGTATGASTFLYVNAENNNFGYNGTSLVSSGVTKPTFGQIWYDTTNNILYSSSDGFNTYVQREISFPICNFAREAGIITNINQVFNGMGYIGSSQWYDKDIVGLSPNGLNPDGTYNNVEIRRTRLTVRSFNTAETSIISYNWQLGSSAHRDQIDYYAQDTQPALSGNWLWYDTLKNKLYGYSSSAGLRDLSGIYFIGGFGHRTKSVVDEFNPKQTFRAIDYNDKPQIASWSMPSSKFVDLTLGASGSTYTAPANGWFFLNKTTPDGGYIALDNSTCKFRSFITSSASSTHNISTYIPAKKGDVVGVTYTTTGAILSFRFIYAEGEV